MAARFAEDILMDVPVPAVWRLLTEPAHMRAWMGEPEMRLEISADWRVGGMISVRGQHHGRFENRGTVLVFEPRQRLCYTHLSSVSRLPDVPESYVRFDFTLSPEEGGTRLELQLTNFPTDSIYRHLAFYWSGTLPILKRYAESALT